MEFTLVRIDNRLMHGIVVGQWCGIAKAQRMMVIDDKVASDDFLKSSMMLARPNGMAVSIISLETALKNMKAGKYQGQKIFLVVKEPQTILALLENNIPISELQIGATENLEGHQLSRRAYASDEELDVYKKICSKGVKVYIQHVPTDIAVDFKK